ncbi:MAG: hypothetical protein ACREDL_12965 [Bradyrhizobium sp.]
MLALTVMLGLMPHDLRAASAHAGMLTAASVSAPMSGKCQGCGDHHRAMTPAACPACCGCFVALPTIATPFEPRLAEQVGHPVCLALAGYTSPPDPYPLRRADPS